MTTEPATFADALVDPAAPGLPERFFDRFMFNAHQQDGAAPSIIVGAGLYPPRDVIDGFAVVTLDAEQRNARFSTALHASDGSSVGPLSWSVVEPMQRWRIGFDDPGIGVAFELDWIARAPAWHGSVLVPNASGASSSFEHLFQSGLVSGILSIDGVETAVESWYSQRDRSRGVRTLSGGQGLHVWFQAQFPDRSVGFLLVEDREHRMLQLEGAVMHTEGRLDPIVRVGHDLTFDGGLDLRGGVVAVVTEGGERLVIDVDASARGGYMAGGGYGGHHGRDYGLDHSEHDVYPLNGSVSPKTVDTALTDRLARFTWDGTPGSGIFEFAHSRSGSYTYRANPA
ncbi:hypothetical protein [Microbacterium aurum]